MWLFRPNPPIDEGFLRAASPNERRCIVRESLGFYPVLVVGGIYEFVEPVDTESILTYAHALRACIDQHPELSRIVANSETESPYYMFCPRLDLTQHVQFLEPNGEDEIKSVQQVLPSILDAAWPASIPAWKIVVLSFSNKKCFIGFSFSHTLGDGVSALAFHRTFLNALQEPYAEKDLICTPTKKAARPAFDTAETLPISWSFLLSPLLGAYLPTPMAALFGFRAIVTSVTAETWTGSLVFYTPETYRTGVEIISVDATTVDKVLQACRMQAAKLTGLIHQLIITALSQSLSQPNRINNFIAGTAINLRKTVGVSDDEMGLFVSGAYHTHALSKLSSQTNGTFSWTLAKSITDRLAVASTELHDQPIGLLRYLSKIRPWTLAKLGTRRDCSYEVSNLLSFKPSGSVKRCFIKEMVFCQPANVTGGPLSFNVISTVNGPIDIAVSWQVGALDVGSYEDEVRFVGSVCQKIRSSFAGLASSEAEADAHASEQEF